MKMVILDRDGVINFDSDNYIKSPDEWIPITGSLEAIARLNNAGYKVAVATNQSGLARGFFDLNTLNLMHHKMYNLLSHYGAHVDGIFFCPHHPDDCCDCRKPKPGLYKQIEKRFKVPLQKVSVIGDSLRDLQAAEQVNANPILVRTGKGLRSEENIHIIKDAQVFDDLAHAVDHLLKGF